MPDDGRLVRVLPGFYAERSFWLVPRADLYQLRRELADNDPGLWWYTGDIEQPA